MIGNEAEESWASTGMPAHALCLLSHGRVWASFAHTRTLVHDLRRSVNIPVRTPPPRSVEPRTSNMLGSLCSMTGAQQMLG